MGYIRRPVPQELLEKSQHEYPEDDYELHEDRKKSDDE